MDRMHDALREAEAEEEAKRQEVFEDLDAEPIPQVMASAFTPLVATNAWIRNMAKDLQSKDDPWRVCKLKGRKVLVHVAEWTKAPHVDLPVASLWKEARTVWSVTPEGDVSA